MSSTVFVNGVTLTDAGWFNDVDSLSYQGVISPINSDYGAVGDGTTDDTTALQNAITAGDIYLPAGSIFKVTATVTAASKRRIWGPGKIRMGANGISALKLSADGSAVEGISMDNPGGFSISGATRSIGIEINAEGCTVSGCKIDGIVNSIISNQSKSRNTITANIITNVLGIASETHGDGIAVFGPNCSVTANTVQCKAATDGRCGIVFDLAGSYGVCTGNTVTGPFRRSVHVELSDGVSVNGNTCQGASQWGVIVSTCDFVVIADNPMIETPTTTTSTLGDCVGIYLFNASFCGVDNNTVKGLGARYGILLSSASDGNNTVTANRLVGAAGKIALVGIVSSGNFDVTIAKNIIQSGLTGSYGIQLFQSVRCRVLGNDVAGCGGSGIAALTSSHNAIIEGNLSRNNTSIGIDVENSTDVIIVGNRCYDDGTGTQTIGVLVFNANRSSTGANNLNANSTGLSTTGTSVGSITYNNIT